MPERARSSSQKREVPSASSRTSRSVHFPHTISAVRHTGHVSSTAISLFTLPTEVMPGSAGAHRRHLVWRIVCRVLGLAAAGLIAPGIVTVGALILLVARLPGVWAARPRRRGQASEQ